MVDREAWEDVGCNINAMLHYDPNHCNAPNGIDKIKVLFVRRSNQVFRHWLILLANLAKTKKGNDKIAPLYF